MRRVITMYITILLAALTFTIFIMFMVASSLEASLYIEFALLLFIDILGLCRALLT